MADSIDNRKHPRITHSSKVKVTDAEGRVFETKTRDLSHGGLYIIIESGSLPEFGTKVTVQAMDIEEAMVNRAQVVRVEAGKGIAIEFLDD